MNKRTIQLMWYYAFLSAVFYAGFSLIEANLNIMEWGNELRNTYAVCGMIVAIIFFFDEN